MSISIREALEAIAIITAMIAVIAVPHPAKAAEIKQLSNTDSVNCEAQYFPLSDVSHGLVHSRPSRAAIHMFSRIT